MQWNQDPNRWAQRAFDQWKGRLDAALLALAENRAPQIEAWMKANAPWTDRTGNARQSLYAEVINLLRTASEIIIEFAYGNAIWYHIFLEKAHGARFAILGPALDTWGPILFADVRKLLGR